MDNLENRQGLSPWFLALPWICRRAGVLIVAVLMITLWTLLLFFNVNWWIIMLTMIIPALILAKWQWYWCHHSEMIPAAVQAGENPPATVKVEV